MFDKWNDKFLIEFFKRPTYEFHFRELLKILHWSPNKLNGAIKRYIISVVLETKKKNLRIFKANYDSDEFRIVKQLFNIYIAKEIAKKINSAGYYDAIVLFGSASRGEDVERSDMDICIIGKSKEINLSQFEKEINRKINLLFIDDISQLRKGQPQLLNNVINGIVLSGYLKVF